MRRFARSCGFAAALVVLSPAPVALGLANRVFVSARSGNDANACDNVKTPCQTFAGAVVQLNAGGEAIVLDTGGYGPVTITQSLTITAPPGVLAFIHPPSPGTAIAITATGATVVLRGLTIVGSGGNFGIDWTGSGSLHVENCVISGFRSAALEAQPAADGALFVKDTIVRGLPGSGGAAVQIWPQVNGGNVKASIDHCDIENSDSDGIFLFGETGTNVELVVRDSVLAFNDVGLLVLANTGGFVQAFADRCSVFGGRIGIHANQNPLLRVKRSSITNNTTGIQDPSGVLETIGDNMVRGNGTDKDCTITVQPGD